MLYRRSFAEAQVRASMLSTTEISTFTFITRSGFKHPNTRRHVRLLGPCFKTGRLKPLCQHPKHANVSRSPKPSRGRAEFLNPNHHMRPRAITHSEECHIHLDLYTAIEIDADPSSRKCTERLSKADPRSTRLTSSVSLSAISRTV
jgi:hypothetical protein